MAGYWYGRQIANSFLELVQTEAGLVEEDIRQYLTGRDDPRLTEIFSRLQEIYAAHLIGK